MASANSTDKLIIFKGDDTGGVFGRRLAFTIEAGDGVDLSGCRAEWIFDGIVKTFAAPLVNGETREVFYSHNETAQMRLGVRYGTFRIIDAAGKRATMTNTRAVEVTNDVARCYPGASTAKVKIGTVISWEQIAGKPLLVKTVNGEAPDASGNINVDTGGDVKHSDFSDMEEKGGMTLKEVGAAVNTLIRKLKGTVSAVAALLAFGAFADGAITPQTDFGDISPTAKLKAVVEASGAISGIDTNTVDALANSAVVTNALTVATTNRVASLESSKANKSALAAHVANTTNNPHAVTAAQVGALPLVEDVNWEKTAVTIGSRTGDVGEDSLANGDGVVASGGCSHAEGYYTTAAGPNSHAEGENTLASGIGSHAEGNDTTARGYYSHTGGINSQTRSVDHYAFAWNGDNGRTKPYSSHGRGTFNINPVGGLNGFYIGEQTLHAILTNKADKADISATNPTFSNAVLAVGLNIDTNSVAVLNDIASTFGGFPLGAGETATTVGALLAALAAAVAWLKKNKVGSFESVGGATATVENGVAKLSDFFTESNSLLTSTIDARLPYPLYAVPSTGLLKDRALNTTSLASVTVPDNFTDLLIRASVETSLSVTMPGATTKYGDTFPGEAGEYLITITKTGATEAYVRTIKMEVANA